MFWKQVYIWKKKIKNNNNNNNQKKIIKKLTCESSQGFCILKLV